MKSKSTKLINNDTVTMTTTLHSKKLQMAENNNKNGEITSTTTSHDQLSNGLSGKNKKKKKNKQKIRHIPLNSIDSNNRAHQIGDTANSQQQLNLTSIPTNNNNNNSNENSNSNRKKNMNNHNNTNEPTDGFWQSMSNTEERQRIREFWLQLGEDERRSLVKVEKEAVLRKMKEQQKHSCNCSVCGKKRTAIEDELEILYDAYYDELEQYANNQQHTRLYSRRTIREYPRADSTYDSSYEDEDRIYDDDDEEEEDDFDEEDDYNVDEDEEDDEDEEEGYIDEDENGERFIINYSEHGSDISDEDLSDSYEGGMEPYTRTTNIAKHGSITRSLNGDHFNFGNSLTVKGGILTVADDLLKNDGKRFLDMMERLAERRMQRDDELVLDEEDDEEDEEDEDDDDLYDEENEEDTRTDEQRMEEGRRMFQIFAARMFEQRVLAAYREKVAKERQQRLIEELEEEDRQRQERERKKQLEKEKKKDKKRQLKKQQEEERRMKEAQKQAEEAKKREEQQRKLEAERQKREKERIKKEEERLKREEERLKKEEEKKRRQKEERERAAEKERQRKEKEEKERQEKELMEKEQKRKEKEEKERKEKILLKNKEQKTTVTSQNQLESTKNKPNTTDVNVQINDQTSSHNKSNELGLKNNYHPNTTPSSVSSNSESNLNNQQQQLSEATRQQILMDALIRPSNSHEQIHHIPPIITNPSTNNHFSPTLSSPLQHPYVNNFSHFDRLQSTYHPLLPTPALEDNNSNNNNIEPSMHHPPLTSLRPLPISLLHQPPPPSLPVINNNMQTNGLISIAPPMETSLSTSSITGRSSLGAIGQPHLSMSSSASTVSTPTATTMMSGIAIPSRPGRRASAMAGPIGSPVNHRYNGLTSDHDGIGFLPHRTSTDNGTGADNSFFSSFLFGEPNKIGSSSNIPLKPFCNNDKLNQPVLDIPLDRRYSIESSGFGWRNAWTSNSLLKDDTHEKLFGDTLTDRHTKILERAKIAYQKLNEITQTKYFISGTLPYPTMTQLHRMMNDLYRDIVVDTRELYEVLIRSPQSGFQCIHHPQHGLMILYEPPSSNSTSVLKDPLSLRRSSVLLNNGSNNSNNNNNNSNNINRSLSPISSTFPSQSLPKNIHSNFMAPSLTLKQPSVSSSIIIPPPSTSSPSSNSGSQIISSPSSSTDISSNFINPNNTPFTLNTPISSFNTITTTTTTNTTNINNTF